MIDLILIASHIGAGFGGWYLHKTFGSFDAIVERIKVWFK